jgi:hypothetical protein
MWQSRSVTVLKGTIGQSGKEAEKPLGKIFCKNGFYGNFFIDASGRSRREGSSHSTVVV